MSETPRVYFSFRSPYSRLGLHTLQRHGIDAELMPFTGPPEGVAFQDPVQNKAKIAYYGFDAPRMTMRMGLPIARPTPFEVDLDAANKAFAAAAQAGKALDFAIAVSDARWGQGANVSDADVLTACAATCGLPMDLIADAQSNEAITATLQHHRSLIEKDQVFGVPFAVYGDRKYWGHERFELLVEDIKADANQKAPAR